MNLSRQIPLRLCPVAGTGVHAWLFTSACRLAREGFAPEVAVAILRAKASREVPLREAQDAVTNAFRTVEEDLQSPPLNRFRPNPRLHPWPKSDPPLIRRVETTGYGLVDLWEESPLRLEPDTPPRPVLAELFAADDLLCAAVVREGPRVRTLAEWGDTINRCRLLVPTPAVARRGPTQDGRPSHRALSLFPRRSFLVVEFDDGATLDQQAARLRFLATLAPLSLVVFSGGKSIHGWFHCAGVGDLPLRQFFGEACRLGADPATWQPHQLVRLPQGRREQSHARQGVYYFNPVKR